jgi:hypothetical protein
LSSIKVNIVINQIKLQLFLFEEVTNTRFQINFLLKNLSLRLEKLSPHDCVMLSKKQKRDPNADLSDLLKNFIRLAIVEEISLNLAANILTMKNFILYFDVIEKEISAYLNYFLINDKDDDDERFLQVGLDDPAIADSLNHDAIMCKIKIDENFQV